LAYEQVGRSPADLPQVCAAAAFFGAAEQFRVAIGGYGRRPLLVQDSGDASPEAIERAARSAEEAYSTAGDAWASPDFRSAVAGTLVRRVVRQVMPP
jgi:CO/xanthine dehydrogenase FAD-binding subunit